MALNQSTEKPTFCQFPDRPLSLARIQDYVCLFGHVIWFPQALDTYRNFHFQPASSGSAHRNSVRTIYVVMSLIVALFAAVFVGLFFQAFITSITGTAHAKGYLTGLQAAGLGLLVAVILVMVCLLQRVVDWVGLVAIPSAIVATIAFVAYFYGIRVSEFSWLGLITVTCVLGMAFGFMTSILLAYCNCTPPNILYALGFSFFTFVLSLIVIAISGIINPVAVNGTESITDSLGVLLVSVLANMVGYLVTFHRIDDWLMGALPRWMAKKRSGTWQKPAVRGSETGGATGNPESSNIRSAG